MLRVRTKNGCTILRLIKYVFKFITLAMPYYIVLCLKICTNARNFGIRSS